MAQTTLPFSYEVNKMETTATVSQPEASPDLSAIAGLAGGNSTVTVILAILVIAGGSAGWKFWNKLIDKKHEEKMKELEIEEKKTNGSKLRKGKK